MARGVRQRNHAPEGGAEDDRALDSERFAKTPDVVPPLRQVPCLARPRLAASVAPVVELDDLRNIG
jgi:hypothetical protein